MSALEVLVGRSILDLPDVWSLEARWDEPEPVTSHMIYPDAEDCMAWDVMPGCGLCGFVFTTANDVGRTEALRGDPRFIVTECLLCETVRQGHLLDYWLVEINGIR